MRKVAKIIERIPMPEIWFPAIHSSKTRLPFRAAATPAIVGPARPAIAGADAIGFLSSSPFRHH